MLTVVILGGEIVKFPGYSVLSKLPSACPDCSYKWKKK